MSPRASVWAFCLCRPARRGCALAACTAVSLYRQSSADCYQTCAEAAVCEPVCTSGATVGSGAEQQRGLGAWASLGHLVCGCCVLPACVHLCIWGPVRGASDLQRSCWFVWQLVATAAAAADMEPPWASVTSGSHTQPRVVSFGGLLCLGLECGRGAGMGCCCCAGAAVSAWAR